MSMRQHIRDAFDAAHTDKGYEHEYEYMYAGVLSSFTPQSILEIGVRHGHSIRAWQKLYPQAVITGLDVERQELVPGPDFNYVIGSSTSHSVVTELGKFDLIIDDGSHHVYDQITTFTNLRKSFNCMYVIEDIGYVNQPHADLESSTKVLETCIQRLGFKGIARYHSYNKRRPCYSLVIQSREF